MILERIHELELEVDPLHGGREGSVSRANVIVDVSNHFHFI